MGMGVSGREVVGSAGKLSCSISVLRSAKGLLLGVGRGSGEGESWWSGGVVRMAGAAGGLSKLEVHLAWLFHSPQVIDELEVLKICISNDINCLINLHASLDLIGLEKRGQHTHHLDKR